MQSINQLYYGPLIQDKPGEPVLSQSRDLLEQPLDFYEPDVVPATQHPMTNQQTMQQNTQCKSARNHTRLTQTDTERSRLPIAQHVYGTACTTR